MPSRPELARLRKGRPYREARLYVLARDGGLCHICGRPGADTADHVVPIAAGGHPTSALNMRAAHRSCNSSRKDNLPTTNQVRDASRQW